MWLIERDSLLVAHTVCKMKLRVPHGYSFYGSSLWDLYGNECNHLYTTWNIAVHRSYELPRTVHTRLLCNITNLPHIKHNLTYRYIMLVSNATKSCNKKVNVLAKMCIGNTLSVTGCYISNILCEYKISMFDIMYGNNVCALMTKSNTFLTILAIKNGNVILF